MDVNPIESLSLLKKLSDKMDKASFIPVTLTTLDARQEKGPEQGHPLPRSNHRESGHFTRPALRWDNGRGRAQRLNSSGVTVVAAPRGTVNAGETVTAAPRETVHAGVTVVTTPKGFCPRWCNGRSRAQTEKNLMCFASRVPSPVRFSAPFSTTGVSADIGSM